MDWINKIHCGDALGVLKEMPDNLVDMVLCSPPYWGLRNYGTEGQIWDGDKNCKHNFTKYNAKLQHENRQNLDGGTIGNPEYRKNLHGTGDSIAGFCSKCGAWCGELGLEPDFNLYIKHLCDIFDEVKRVLKDTGTIWINIGDTYWGGGNAHGHKNDTKNCGKLTGITGYLKNPIAIGPGYKSKSLCCIPDRFRIEMINRGWILRNKIEWFKKNCMPSSANDRFTVDFEDICFFTKSNKIQYWTNEKTFELVSKQPLGTKGSEGKDWEWREINGKKKKVSLWTGHDYYFEQQFEEHLTRENRPDGITRNRLFDYDSKENKMRGFKDKPTDKSDQRPMFHGKDINYGEQGRNKRCVWEITTQPFSEAHFACVSEDTECLTINGWKKYFDIKRGELIASFDMKNKVIKWTPCSYIKTYNIDTKIIKIGNRDLDILMTLNHRNIVLKRNEKEIITRADNLKYSDKIRVSADFVIPEHNSIGKDTAELLGWIISEGHFQKDGGIYIYQNEGYNARRIRLLLHPYGFTEKIRRNFQIEWYIQKKSALMLKALIPYKKLNRDLVFIPLEEANRLFYSLIKGDGCVRKDGRIQFIQKDKETVDWFSILAMRLGYSVRISKRKDNRIYQVYLTKRTHIGIRATNGKGKSIVKVNYKGIIWCPKTKYGTWIAKRNGRIWITGNTFPEELCVTPIHAGCPEFVCKKCGKPREKIYDTKFVAQQDVSAEKGKRGHEGNKPMDKSNQWQDYPRGFNENNFVGYTDCGCNAGFEPGVALDPFSGAGTTCLVAKKLGRNYIGIELKPEYANMSERRIHNQAGLL